MTCHVFNAYGAHAHFVDPAEIHYAELDFKANELIACHGAAIWYRKHHKSYSLTGPTAELWADLEKRAGSERSAVLVTQGKRGYFVDTTAFLAFARSTREIDRIRYTGEPSHRSSKDDAEEVVRLFCRHQASLIAPAVLFDSINAAFASTRQKGAVIAFDDEHATCTIDLGSATRVATGDDTVFAQFGADQGTSFRIGPADAPRIAQAVSAFARKNGWVNEPGLSWPRSGMSSFIDPKSVFEIKIGPRDDLSFAKMCFRPGGKGDLNCSSPTQARRILAKIAKAGGLTRILGGEAPLAIRLSKVDCIGIAREYHADRHAGLYLRIDDEIFDILPEEVPGIVAEIRAHSGLTGFSLAKLGRETMTWLSADVDSARIVFEKGKARLNDIQGLPLGTEVQGRAFFKRHVARIPDAIPFEEERGLSYVRTSLITGVHIDTRSSKEGMVNLHIRHGHSNVLVKLSPAKATKALKLIAKRAGLKLLSETIAIDIKAIAAISLGRASYEHMSQLTFRGSTYPSWGFDFDGESFLAFLGMTLPVRGDIKEAA